MTFLDKRTWWAAPRYVYASTYLAGLAATESAEAVREFSRLTSQWPQFKAEIRHQYEAQLADQHRREKERAEKERLSLDARKKELKSARKQKTH